MNVICPACGKHHRISEQLAGKRAKCGCGQFLTIPAVSEPPSAADEWPAASLASDALPDALWESTGGSVPPGSSGTLLFQCKYGVVRPFMWWLLGGNLITALVAIPTGIFWNEGWSLRNLPLQPWLATLLFESVGFGLLLLIAYLTTGYLLHRDRPQRVAVTTTGVILPKHKLSRRELFIPWAEVRVRHWGGPVQHLYFKRGFLRTSQLVSIQFPTDRDFETFVGHLRQHHKV